VREFFVAPKKKPKVRRGKRETTLPVMGRPAIASRGAVTSSASARRSDLVKLVKAGVERFILENATMEEFLRTLRMAGEPESLYAHQLTGSVLSRIVRQAIDRRKPRRKKTGPR